MVLKKPSYKCGYNTTGLTSSHLIYDGIWNMHDYAEMGEYRDADIQDKYTYYNGELSYPVGLMTADEVAFAGVVYGEENTDAYYNLNALDENIVGSYNWWIMTPSIIRKSR